MKYLLITVSLLFIYVMVAFSCDQSSSRSAIHGKDTSNFDYSIRRIKNASEVSRRLALNLSDSFYQVTLNPHYLLLSSHFYHKMGDKDSAMLFMDKFENGLMNDKDKYTGNELTYYSMLITSNCYQNDSIGLSTTLKAIENVSDTLGRKMFLDRYYNCGCKCMLDSFN